MRFPCLRVSRRAGFSPAVVTGKPLHLFGSEGREEATGRGVMYALEEALGDRGRELAGTSVALQGFGNVGSHAARLIAERGGRIVAVADHMGAVSNEPPGPSRPHGARVTNPRQLVPYLEVASGRAAPGQGRRLSPGGPR